MTETKKVVANLNATRFRSAEYERNVWVVTPDAGVDFEDLASPKYWANVANMLKPYDKIEVRADDGSYYGELLVVYNGSNFAQTRPISFVKLDVAEPQSQGVAGLEVKWRGPHSKWSVVRNKENGFDVLKDQFASRALASKWAIDNQAVAA